MLFFFLRAVDVSRGGMSSMQRSSYSGLISAADVVVVDSEIRVYFVCAGHALDLSSETLKIRILFMARIELTGFDVGYALFEALELCLCLAVVLGN